MPTKRHSFLCAFYHVLFGVVGIADGAMLGNILFAINGQSTCPGTHAEQLAAPEHTCLKLPEDIPFDVGVLLTGDGLGVPYHVSHHFTK